MSNMSDLNVWLERTFHLSERKTNVGQEFRAATATFLTMSYILLVNPQLLSKVGIPATAIVVSTALASFVGSFIAGYFGNLPLGLSPGIGLSAYLTYGLILGEGLTVQEAFTSCFISGVLLFILSVTGLSSIVMKLIPRSVKLATIVGMGLQIALVGMTSVKLVVPNEQTIVGLGDIHSPQIWLSIIGLVLIGSLLFHQVRGGILIGIFAMTLIDWMMRGHVPTQFMQLPDLNINMAEFIGFEGFSIARCMTGILAFLFIGVIDVSGVIFGMASLADLTEPDGTIPGATPTFIAVALSTIVSAATGGTPVIVYVESAAGIKEGGRTGLTAVIISAYFLLSLFFAPVLSEIPLIATSPVAILVGAMMMSQSVEIDWNNMSEAIPAFLTLVTMPFTFSITNGIVLGLITALMFYVTTGQLFEDVKVMLYGESAATEGGVTELAPLQPRAAAEALEAAINNKQSEGSVFSTDSPLYGGRDKTTAAVRIPVRSPEDRRRSHGGASHVGSYGGSYGVAKESGNHSFMDGQTFVRQPSLILRKKDADAVRDAHGRSVSQDMQEDSAAGAQQAGSYGGVGHRGAH